MRGAGVTNRGLSIRTKEISEYPIAQPGLNGTVLGQGFFSLDYNQTEPAHNLGRVPPVNAEMGQRRMDGHAEQQGYQHRAMNEIPLWKRLVGWRDQHEYERAFLEPNSKVEDIQLMKSQRAWAPPQTLNTIPTKHPGKTGPAVDHLRIRK